ncbi:MAG TPA: adenylate/guanylate cyclase domain-containing protein [Candidatus Limnocylindrales bacterium]|nr:adenylate/guanylate cyclase domain-containing protein [Candidatus Limnocylindrales bacterium]
MEAAPGQEGTPDAVPATSSVERRIVTVLFADLVGFTTLAEGLDPEDLATIQDAYFAAVREVVGRHQGQLEKFIGDAAMAVFGTPRSHDDDALRAVRAGIALVHAVGSLGARLGLEAEGLRLRVGVNTGEVLVAVEGADAGRVSGDTVNVAARLQTAAPPDGILVGELTALSIADAVELEAAEPLPLKGKREPVRAARAVGLRPERSRELAMGRLRAPLLGRDEDLQRLLDAADRAAAQGPVRILVVAPPGVGKTRLAAEAAERLSTSGWRVLHERVSAGEGPFEPVAGLIAAALSIPGPTDEPDPSPAILDRLAARLRGIDPGRVAVIVDDVRALLDPAVGAGEASEPSGSSTAADRTSRFESWLDALEAASGRTPTAWVVEDLHWASSDMLAFLDAAAARSGRQLLVIGTARPAALEAGVTGERNGGWEILHLSTLRAVACAALVQALVGDALPPALVNRVVARSDGNCLFVEELLRTWVAVGVLAPSGDGWELTADPADVPLPHTVQGIYAAQLDDLPGAARAIARRGAVAGRHIPAAALPSLGIASGDEGLEVLRRRALVGEPTETELIGPEYPYRHALLRDAGYASLGRGERAELHVRLAHWLETIGGDVPQPLAAAIGGHYADAIEAAPALATVVGDGLDRAAVATLAASWLERGAEHAHGQSAHAAAAEALRRSLALTPTSAPVERARRGRLLGDVLRAVDMEAAAEAYTNAVDEARTALTTAGATATDDAALRRELGLATAGIGQARYEQIRFAEARDAAERALPYLMSDRDRIPVELALLRAREGLTNAYEALAGEAAGVAARATATGDAALAFEAERLATGLRSSVGLATAAEWEALADQAGTLGRWADAAEMLVNAAIQRFDEDRARARDIVARAEEVARQRALHNRLVWMGQVRCEFGLVTGDWEESIAAARRTLDLAVAGNYHRAAVRTWSALTPILAARNERELLAVAAAWFRAWAHIFPDSPYGTVLHLAVDIRLAAAGLVTVREPDPARLMTGIGVVDDSGSYLAAVETIVDWLIATGRLDDARAAAARYAASTSPRQTALRDASIALVQAHVRRAEGQAAEAAAAAADAVRIADNYVAPWWQLRARQAEGRPTHDAETARLAAMLGLAADDGGDGTGR